MSLIDYDMFYGKIDKVKIAIERLKTFEPQEGYYLAFSGGKDSIVIKKLTQLSKVKYDTHYNNTTIDPPELIYFIRKYHPDVKIEMPEKSLLAMITVRGFPLRQSRWCCEVYKEGGGENRFVITGIRKAESQKRASRKMIETCWKKSSNKKFFNVIFDWTEKEVWEFIKKYKLPYCKLYDEGFKRIGCLLCPMATLKSKKIEMEKYPKYTKLFIRAFEKLYQNRKEEGRSSVNRWKSGKDMFDWWISGKGSRNPDQTVMFE